MPVSAFVALGHPGRLSVLRLLMRRAPFTVRPAEMARALGIKPSTLSAYLGILSRAGLVTAARDGRALHYRADLGGLAALTRYLAADCGRSRPELWVPHRDAPDRTLPHLTQTQEIPAMADRVFNVLFICTGNSARSIFAEAILNREGAGKFRAYSAGTNAAGGVNPQVRSLLQQLGYETEGLRSKMVEEFQGPDAPRFDFVFTVCDAAANEECPIWPGQPMTAHWGMPDPVKVEGTETERSFAFRQAYQTMRRRMTGFIALPIESLDRLALQGKLDSIGADRGKPEDAAAPAPAGPAA